MTIVVLSSDRLEAFLTLESAAELSGVRNELSEAGVVHGILNPELAQICAQGTGGESVCIARGTAPGFARPERLELEFESAKTAGRIDPISHRMDFRERGTVHNVFEGERLGVLLPALEGAAGIGVDGVELAPAPSAELSASIGPGVRVEEQTDGSCVLFAELDGVVRVAPSGELFVTDMLSLPGDVDLSTGNIDVLGSVSVGGTVRAGFKVQACHDVDVDAAVEDATVTAGKSLTVGAGILGGGSGVVVAGKSIQAKYAQNATLRCGGDVVLQVDTNSGIECAGLLSAREGAGHLRGGTYWAGAGLWARELGSAQGVPTLVQVGNDPHLTRELARVRSDLRVNGGRVMKLQRERGVASAKRVGRSLTRDQAGNARRTMKAQRELLRARRLLEAREAELERGLALAAPPFVRVESRIHAGVRLQIQNSHLTIDQSRAGGTFLRDDQSGEITCSS